MLLSMSQRLHQLHLEYFPRKIAKVSLPPLSFWLFLMQKQSLKQKNLKARKKGQYYVTVSIDSKSQLWRASAQ